MALKEIANTDRQITITPKGVWTYGVPTYTESPSTKVKACGKAVLLISISWLLAPGACIMAGYNFIGGGTFNPISATATKTTETVMGGKPIRINDKGDCKGAFVLNVPPFTVVNCQCDFEVTAAGQIKCKCA